MRRVLASILLFLAGAAVHAQAPAASSGNMKIFPGTSVTMFGSFTNSGTLTVDNGATITNRAALITSGSITNSGTFVYTADVPLQYAGSTLQSIGSEFPASGKPILVVNNAAGVRMTSDLSIDKVSFMSGHLLLNGQTLTLNGTVTRTSGGFAGSPSSSMIVTVPATLHFDQSDAASRTLKTFTLNAASSTVRLGNMLEVADKLVLTTGTLAADSNLKLNSNSTQTAIVPALGSSASVSGKVIVERFVPAAARRWRFMSSPVGGTTAEDWRGEIFLTGPGTGTTTGTLNSNGFDATQNNSPSLYSYNESAAGNSSIGWVAAPNTSMSLASGRGYRVFVRGDRSSLARLTGADNTQGAVTMNLVGTMNTGNVTMPVTYTITSTSAHDGWNLLGNPYPCPYDWNSFWNAGNFLYSGTNYSGIDPTIYVWDASTNSYKSYNASSASGAVNNGIIASGQAFFAKATGILPSMTFREQFKVQGVPTQMFKTAVQNELSITLYADSLNRDEFILKMLPGSMRGDDVGDSRKMYNPTVNIASYASDSIMHCLDVRPSTAADTVNLQVTGNMAEHRMIFNSLPKDGRFYFLEDTWLNNITPISAGHSYSFRITAQPGTQGNSRFRIIISPVASLPVSFGTFAVSRSGARKALLHWTTLSEQNSAHFAIERSDDNINFQAVGIRLAKGNTSSLTEYTWEDELPAGPMTFYYRIRQVDWDQSNTLSPVRSLHFNGEGVRTAIELFPNPVVQVLNVHIGSVQGTVSCKVFGESGREVLKADAVTTADGRFSVDVESLAGGLYILEITDADGLRTTAKFVK